METLTAAAPTVGAVSVNDLAELIASFSDVTSRLESTHDQLRDEVARLNDELSRANEQLERSRRLTALGEMAAGIAHEVRNPLGSIRLYTRILRQDLVDRPAERDTVDKIDAAACGLDAIVGDVLTFSREFTLRAAECDASELISQALEHCQHDGVKGWRGTVVVRDDEHDGAPTGRALWVDRGLAQQALVNVIRNAFEAIADAAKGDESRQHRLTVSVSRRDMLAQDGVRRQADVISVRDTGSGVSPEVVARMFNPFFTTRSTGTGLGLSIVHRIVDAHGGRVVVRDNAAIALGEQDHDPRGTTIELYFPTSSAHAERAKAA